MKLKTQLSKQLISLANKYEVSSFCDEDPSQFLNWYKKGAQVDHTIYSKPKAALSYHVILSKASNKVYALHEN